MYWIFDRIGIRKYFDSIILSAIANEVTGKANYNITLDHLHLKKEKSVFINNKTENIEGAEQVKIKGLYLVREKFDFQEILKEQTLL